MNDIELKKFIDFANNHEIEINTFNESQYYYCINMGCHACINSEVCAITKLTPALTKEDVKFLKLNYAEYFI